MESRYYGMVDPAGRITGVFRSLLGARLCAAPHEQKYIHELEVREIRPVGENEQPTHWCWVRAGDTHFSMIWGTRLQLDCSFYAGVDYHLERGHGRIAQLVITPVRPVYPE